MTIEIVNAGEDHIEALVPLFDSYRVFYGHSSDLDAARTFLSERIRLGESVIYLAMCDGVPFGFTQLFPSFSSASMQRLWILNDLYVEPAARRRSIGRKLVDCARELAVSTQAKSVILETAMDNTTAQALYDDYGFVKDTEFFRYALTI